MREAIEKSARHLYGLVHARYIVTTRGLAKMVSQTLLTILTPHSKPQENQPLTHTPPSLSPNS
jgi:Casein kinase II regulatory subunit